MHASTCGGHVKALFPANGKMRPRLLGYWRETRWAVGQLNAMGTSTVDAQAQALAPDYLAPEAAHRDPDASADDAPGAPASRIELF